MKKELPKSLVTSVEVFRKYHGHDLDVTVHFNVFGEVLGFENDYFDLPEAAKKMTYGNNLPPEIKVLDIFTKEIKIFLPMMAMGLNGDAMMPHWLIPMQTKLEELKTKSKEVSVYIPRDYIRDEWTRALYESRTTGNYHRLFPFFIKDEKDQSKKMNNLFSNLAAIQSKALRDDLKNGKEYANLYFVFSLLQTVDADAVERITKQMDTTASSMLIDISTILNKEILMEKRLEKDMIGQLLNFINVEGIKNFAENFSKNIQDKFKISDPVLMGMLRTYLFKMRGGAELQKSKSTMTDVFRDFYNIFKPY